MDTREPAQAARRTPWEIVFDAPVFRERHFPAIRAEIEARGVAAADPGAFVMLAAVGTLLRDLRTPDDGDGPQEASDAVLRYGALAFHAYHFDAHGQTLFTLTTRALDRIVALDKIGDWTLRTPAPAGYVQLPRHRVWTPGGAGTPEPVDGFFWVAAEPAARLDLLLCTGVRPGRPGIGVIDLAVPLPAPAPGHWGDVDAREGAGPDFANVLPGGELDALYALTNGAEALKLTSRIFWTVATRPDAVSEAASPGPAEPAAGPHAMPPSALAARTIGSTAD